MLLRPFAFVLLLLAGCGGPQDAERPGTWQATGVNDANLAAMLADPHDAVLGVAAGTERAEPGSAAIRRLERDRRRPLPDSRASSIGGAGGAPAGAAPSGDSGR